MKSALGYMQAEVPMSQPAWPLLLPSFIVGTINKLGHNREKLLAEGLREGEQNPRRLFHALCTAEESSGLDTYPAIGKNGIALFHQDVFDDDGVQNGHHRPPAIKNPKPREIHIQSIAHGQLEQEQLGLRSERCTSAAGAQGVWAS